METMHRTWVADFRSSSPPTATGCACCQGNHGRRSRRVRLARDAQTEEEACNAVKEKARWWSGANAVTRMSDGKCQDTRHTVSNSNMGRAGFLDRQPFARACEGELGNKKAEVG